MINNNRIGPIQTNELQPAVRTSRIRALRILGGVHISLGVVCGILGIVGAILSNTDMDIGCKQMGYYDNYYGHITQYSYYHCGNADIVLIMNLICMTLSGWFILTGCLPLCMTEKRKSSWKCLTVAFLVCNIISAAVVSSTVFSLAVVGALFASFDTYTGSVIAVSGFQAVFSFIEFLISIVAAAHCCCCSQLNTGNQQRVIFINTSQSGMINNMPNTQIPTGNQQGYHQMWMPQMQGYYVQQPANMANNQQHADHSNGNQMPIQGYYGQQPANIPNYQQQAGHLQGNQIPIQGYYMQQPQSFEMANQQLHINNEQFLHPTAPAVDTNQPFPLTESSVRSEI